MRIIDCDPAEIRLRLPPCAQALNWASLTGPGGTVQLTATVEPIDPLDPDARLVTLTGIPADVLKGVWTLNLASDCGCWYTNVYLNMCPRPQMLSEHVPTPGAGGPSIECCLPEPSADWDTSPAYAVFDVTLPGDSFVITLHQPVLPNLTINYADGTFTFGGTPAGLELIELVDRNGIVVATSGTNEVSFAEALLKCTSYSVRFTIGETPPPGAMTSSVWLTNANAEDPDLAWCELVFEDVNGVRIHALIYDYDNTHTFELVAEDNNQVLSTVSMPNAGPFVVDKDDFSTPIDELAQPVIFYIRDITDDVHLPFTTEYCLNGPTLGSG